MARVKRIDHIAIVVDEMENTLSFWRDALGIELQGLKDVAAEMAQVAFLPRVGIQWEILSPQKWMMTR